jgi:BON domain-containing protein
MFRRFAAVGMIGLLSVVTLAAAGRTAADDQQTNTEVRRALLRLPYYGVFDYLAFRQDRGVVTLMGYAYAPGLKSSAAKVVKRVPGVDEVKNEIVELSASSFDDRIRWNTFYRIYNDSLLSRYAPGGGLTRFDRFSLRRFPGTQPFGYYPIHIVVNRGRTLLLGNVDFESDKITAGFRAREVFGAFAVDNEIMVSERGTR